MQRAIEASTTIGAAACAAVEVLRDDAATVLGESIIGAAHQFRLTLEVDLRAGAAVRRDIIVDVGIPRFSRDSIVVPAHWRALRHDRLFPTFDGELEVSGGSDTTLRMCGVYRVPLGPIGRFGDGVVGRRLARQSLAKLVEHLAGRLDLEVARRASAVDWRPAPYPISLREDHPELYLG